MNDILKEEIGSHGQKEWYMKNWQIDQMPRSGGGEEAKETENAMGGPR